MSGRRDAVLLGLLAAAAGALVDRATGGRRRGSVGSATGTASEARVTSPARPGAGTSAGRSRADDAAAAGAEQSAAPGPMDLGPDDWRATLRRVGREFKDDGVMRLGAAVAYYLVLALVPGVVAAVSLLGLVASPGEVVTRLGELAAQLPGDTGDLVLDQARTVATAESGTLGLTLVAGVLGALWTASAGTKALVEAVTIAYDEVETRGFVALRGTALALTVGLVLFLGAAVTLVGGASGLADALGLPDPVGQVLRFPVLLVVVLLMLAVLYRFAPDRADPEWRWVSVGAAVAAVLWLLVTAGFTVYVETFGSYDETYGSLAGVVVLLLWLQLTAVCFVMGAEVNAELERQTTVDTTTGPDRPMGERGAVAADYPPGVEPVEVEDEHALVDARQGDATTVSS